MKNSTRDKLFKPGETYRVFWELDRAAYGPITMLGVNGRAVLIHEYKDEADGFEVYVAVSGNSLDRTRIALGLDEPPVIN